jgi:uncharacterized protein YkwD
MGTAMTSGPGMMGSALTSTPGTAIPSGSAAPSVTNTSVSPLPSASATGSVATGADVPAGDYCSAVADWDPEWVQWEEDVLELVNAYRSMGYNCDTEGNFGAAPPLTMEPILRCSARLHSLDMFTRGYFSHDNPDGLDPFDRMANAGFKGQAMGENIAQGQMSPEDVMTAWMDSDGHCSNIMNPTFTLIGVGYHPGSASDRKKQRYWTQNFGTPLKMSGGMGGTKP